MYVIIMSSGRTLKGEYSGKIVVFDTESAAHRHLDSLVYRARHPRLLSDWKVSPLFP